MYSLQTSLIILGMIITGAARSVGVKLLYQLGFDNYLFVVIMYLIGQSMALVVYGISNKCCLNNKGEEYDGDHEYSRVSIKEDEGAAAACQTTTSSESSDEEDQTFFSNNNGHHHSELELQPIKSSSSLPLGDEDDDINVDTHLAASAVFRDLQSTSDDNNATLVRSQSDPTMMDAAREQEYASLTSKTTTCTQSLPRAHTMPLEKARPIIRRRGSKTGLTQESHDAVAWVHTIPWQLKPLIPGLLNLANAALKWASFIYVAASIAEMLMAGLELVLSVIVARIVRKRQVSKERWAGVAIVAIGLWMVHAADVLDTNKHANAADAAAAEDRNGEDSNNNNTHSVVDGAELQREHVIGAALIVGQCITAVGQDMAEELFLHEAHFPPTLLLGLEGLYGLAFGIPLYLIYAPESPWTTLQTLEASTWETIYVIILTIIFTVTGIFNIMATDVTSSMTRNMWKNCRTILVWVLGLVLFYSVHNNDLGEEWVIPDSFFILGGFLIMLSGIYVYYKNK